MQKTDIRKFLFSGFDKDMQDIIKNNIVENKWSYELELFLLTLKSISPNQDVGGNTVDYSRFDRELELWENYRHGGDRTVMSLLRNDRSNYWNEKDESLLTRLLAIILSNEDKSILKSEVLKHTLFFTGNPERILDSIVYNSLLSNMLLNKGSNMDILESLKRDIIEVSILEDIVKKGYVMMSLEDYSGDYIVDFEKKRIEFIMSISNRESKFESLIKLLDRKDYNGSSKYLDFLYPLLGTDCGEYDHKFLEEITDYIYKLRKGRISPRNNGVQEAEQVDIFKMNEGEIRVHPLLNKIKLLSISNRDGFEVRLVKSKSGIYRFFKK